MASCPAGFFPIPGDVSNCANFSNVTVVSKICSSNLFLQSDGTCGTGNPSILNTADTYCGPEYAGQNCVYHAQVTPGLTGNVQSIPNTICAFQKDGMQFPCDIGCCSDQTLPPGAVLPTTSTVDTPGFPLWAIILIIVLSVLFVILFVYLFKSRRNGNGGRVRLHDSL